MIITTSTMVHTFGSLSRLSRGILSVHGVGIDEPKYSFVNELVVRILTIAKASLFLKAELFEQVCGGKIGIRKAYTHYRDCYLDALWYAAEYEWRIGQRYIDTGNAEMQEATQRKQQEHFGRAAQKYQSYAMYACNSKFDAKVTFGAHGEFGERIGMSERALRRSVVLLGAIGKTDLVNQVWSAYYTQMKSVSDQRWQPSKETQADVEAARSQTSAYRFAAQVSQMSSEFSEQQRSGGQ